LILEQIIERALYEQIEKFVDSKSILTNNQYGFRTGKNSTDAISHLISDIANGIELKIMVGAIFYDLKKAFETITHKSLINKL